MTWQEAKATIEGYHKSPGDDYCPVWARDNAIKLALVVCDNGTEENLPVLVGVTMNRGIHIETANGGKIEFA